MLFTTSQTDYTYYIHKFNNYTSSDDIFGNQIQIVIGLRTLDLITNSIIHKQKDDIDNPVKQVK